MQNIISFLFRGKRLILKRIKNIYHLFFTKFLFYVNKVSVKNGLKSYGIPYVIVARGGKCTIGSNFSMNNITSSNPIGRIQKCILAVDNGGMLKIGNNVGISFVAINCQKEIVIEDYVTIGGGTCIYDSDYHPLNASDRMEDNSNNIVKKSVLIKLNAFIGANSTILKGVTIGENSIIGACSVVTKNVPANQIWAGNPARFIKNI